MALSICELRTILHERYPELELTPVRHADLMFEERVRLKCFQCANYQTKWTCPGRLPQLDFPKLIGEYKHLAVVRYQQSAVSSQESEIRNQKTEIEYKRAGNELHKAMLYLESELFKRGNPLAQSFIGGSCELCDEGCSPDRCANPAQARIPWDATGCNVTRSLANIGIHVDFTGKDICRYGLLVW